MHLDIDSKYIYINKVQKTNMFKILTTQNRTIIISMIIES